MKRITVASSGLGAELGTEKAPGLRATRYACRIVIRRIPIVGVMGSGSSPHAERAAPIGRWLAELGVHLLTGGGGGVMAAVSQAFSETQPRLGSVIGIIPSGSDAVEPG